jgi:hypothetical protein
MTNTNTTTQIGAHKVWFSAEHNSLRMSDASGHGDFDFEVEAFSRRELSEAHSLFMAAQG